MCGIVGYVGENQKAIPVLINGLKCLEYRGYDSAGIAYQKNSKIKIIKEVGKIANLESKIDLSLLSNVGIAHTRWATHGGVSKVNSHPHTMGKFTIVHNGIIENYAEIKENLSKNGYIFKTSTDTEVLAAIIDYIYNKTKDILKTLNELKNHVIGSYAVALVFEEDKDAIYAIKKDSPLIVGIGVKENYIASDVPAILKYTNKYITLLDNEFVRVTSREVEFYGSDGKRVKKDIKEFKGDANDIDKLGYDHFMLKEMYEEPNVIRNTISLYIEDDLKSLKERMPDFSKYESIDIVACGSAMHVGMLGKTFIENYASIPVNVEVASEYRYKKLFLNNKTLVIAISQSGETADTLAAVKIAKEMGADTLGIINVVESTIARETDMVLYTRAGSEIAVATTKAYLSQMAMLILIAINAGISRNKVSKKEALTILEEFRRIPTIMDTLFENRDNYKSIAKSIYKNQDIFYIGRGVDYAISLEGSLKLKEISYTNCQAYQAGELKHGTISLVEKNTPVISVVTDKSIADKTVSNIKEVKARGAKVILITTSDLDKNGDYYDSKIVVPSTNPLLQSLLTIIPLQFIAYEVAVLRGCDIDKPRNLAKSVTVE